MQTRRSYMLEHVQDGYVVARPPDPAGVTLPTDEELRPPDQRPQPEVRPPSPETPPRVVRRAASADLGANCRAAALAAR
eukprot:15459877-Alexandrium_andersonii.AAC.1